MERLPNGAVLKERYKVLSALGKGSFAWVYLARDLQWKGNLVALKQIRTDGFTPTEYRALNASFLQEAAFLMTLHHRNLPRVVEFFAEGPCYYLALEWLPGKTLEEAVRTRDDVDEMKVIQWGCELCDVLAFLHEQRPHPIVLGDLKPSNVIVKYDDSLAVIDFGLARHAVNTNHKSKFSMVTPGFSPPEQYHGGPAEPRGDIYALGATLFWCLTQAPMDRLGFKIPPVRQLREEISPQMEEVILTCMQPDSRKRYSDVRALWGHLHLLHEALQREQQAVKPSDILSALYRKKKD